MPRELFCGASFATPISLLYRKAAAITSLLQVNDRNSLLQRLACLSVDATAQWGTLGVEQMLAHLCDSIRASLNNTAMAPINRCFRFPGLRWLMLHVLPWPKARIKGPPEAFVSAPEEFQQQRAELKQLIHKFIHSSAQRAWPDHPYFGRFNYRDWATLHYRHLDHHLRQFAV